MYSENILECFIVSLLCFTMPKKNYYSTIITKIWDCFRNNVQNLTLSRHVQDKLLVYPSQVLCSFCHICDLFAKNVDKIVELDI